MIDRTAAQQARINALMQLSPSDLDLDSVDIQHQLLFYAEQGMKDPALLSELELKQVCFALVVHYRVMGIE